MPKARKGKPSRTGQASETGHRSKASQSPKARPRSGVKSKSTAAQSAADKTHKSGPEQKTVTFPIVGIGGSAGALEALVQVLGSLSPDTGMGFVFIQHLDPTHESMLADILARSSKIPVHEARDRMPVQPNHLYLVTPNKDLMIANGVLRVMPRSEPPALHMPIDHFFRSLAEDLGPAAIGVVLSGTGTDGAHGVLAIKAGGGITFAQEPASAKYDGMPRAAIASDEMDFVLPPERIAQELNRILERGRPAPVQSAPADVTDQDEEDLRHILTVVQAVSGIDLSYFKQSNLLRRVHRRMLLNNLTSVQQYRRMLRENSSEAMALQHDILISVTSFFRDGASVDGLARVVFPTILKNRSNEQAIRIWVPGAATGEEAYSIAIALTEFLDARSGTVPMQIFATDISETAIERARAGLYPPNAVADMAPNRLRRFFVKLDNGYQVNKSIRERCVFARHNLIADPPFSQIDLVSCRNVLIYFRPEYQRRAIDAFYYALKPTGFLTLGRSESVGAFGNMFTSIDSRYRIYAKRPNALGRGAPVLGGPAHPRMQGTTVAGRANAHAAVAGASADALQKEADRLVMERYAPPGIVINEDLEVVQFRGRIGGLLEPAPGLATLNLIKMARADLRLVLQGALYEARKRGGPVRKERLEFKHEGRNRRINIEITPLKIPDTATGYYLVLFEEPALPAPPAPTPERTKPEPPTQRVATRELEALKKELSDSRSQTQAIIEELEATNEEMKAANEEVLSSNEELQSMNEELETAKEELQSANEELTTLNEELQNRNNELGQVAADLSNLLASVGLPIIMVSRDLKIRRYTPMATKVLNVIASDSGRPISDINLNINVPDLETLVVEAMESMAVREREVRDRSGRAYSLRIQPFRTLDNHIDGAVIILIDIDAFRRDVETAHLSRDFVQTILDTITSALVVLDEKLQIQTANRSFYETFKCSAGEVVGRQLREINHGMWDVAQVTSMLKEALTGNSVQDHFKVALDVAEDGKRAFTLNTRLLSPEPNRGRLLLLAIHDADPT
ncbi:MAG TPA: chemotaxis protein CheB [Candidatus Binataceae bacterium]|nr:chemotaxis protein CheB [Candidatus Binataceae bacterium]